MRWDNRQVTVDDAPVWAAQVGEITLPVSEFVAAVTAFHHRLLAEMEQRVAALTASPLPDVEIDLEALRQEQADRSGGLAAALHPEAAEPLRDEVRSALRVLDQHLL